MAKTKVLLVDDDIDFLAIMKANLEASGYEVFTGESGEETGPLIDEHTPDIVVMDLMLEHYDTGFVVCYEIKKKRPSLPVIICSAVEQEEGLAFDTATEEERAWIKADAFLAKPIRYEQLLNRIKKLLNK